METAISKIPRLEPMEPAALRFPRLESVDLLRGLVMILMALDHTRDFFGVPGMNPVDLDNTTVTLFFTRWITHLCAPTFFLLTGTGAYLSLRKKTKRELSRFLFTRGLWLIFLEIVVLRCFAWQWNFDYHLTILTVIWALGWAMITLSALVFLPDWAVITFGLVLIAGHNLLDPVQAASLGWLAPIWIILHQLGPLMSTPTHQVLVAYVLVPWVGVTAVGYGLGQIFLWNAQRRKKFLLRLGIGLVVAFVALRAANVYGDPLPWSKQRSTVFTILSLLNTNKYPPSLLFLLMTLGPAMLLLRAFERSTPTRLRPVLTFGRVPLFYYILHPILIHLIALMVCLARYHAVHWMFESPNPAAFPITPPPGWGFSLPVVYGIWVFVVFALYPLCRWFAAVKQRRSDAWLSYL